MSALFQFDWRELFVPTLNIGEIILRGSVVYLFIFFVFRILRREAGAIGIDEKELVRTRPAPEVVHATTC